MKMSLGKTNKKLPYLFQEGGVRGKSLHSRVRNEEEK